MVSPLTYCADDAGAVSHVGDESKALGQACENVVSDAQVGFWAEGVLAVCHGETDDVGNDLASLAGFEYTESKRVNQYDQNV